MTFDQLSKIVLFTTSKFLITMAGPLEICELIEQLTWLQWICLVHSKKSYMVRNLMAIMASKKKCAKKIGSNIKIKIFLRQA